MGPKRTKLRTSIVLRLKDLDCWNAVSSFVPFKGSLAFFCRFEEPGTEFQIRNDKLHGTEAISGVVKD